MTVPPPPSAEYFDQWYADLATSPAREDVLARTLGLPPELESTSLLPWSGIAEVADALALAPGDLLVDLACGRGGYGLEVARRTGARLLGIDFAAVAIEYARRRGGDGARFEVGELTRTGRPDGSVAAVMCIDAMQFADPYADGIAEARRILAPGGRLVLTGWQADDPGDEQVPARLRRDIAEHLRAAGFADVSVAHRPAWRSAELAHWQAAVELDPTDDPGVQSMQDEGRHVLPWLERTRRVLARAVAPDAS